MSAWPSTRARRVLAALLRIGWAIKRQSGSHRTLSRPEWADFVFAFHDDEEIGHGCWPGSPSVLAYALRTYDPRNTR
jgi:predicted RNA binding protein YcfA (HicA-like mRNA interferase family)